MKERVKTTSPVKWLFSDLPGYKALYVFAMFLTVVYNIMQLTVPVFSQYIVDLFLNVNDPERSAQNLTNHRDWLILLVVGMIGFTLLRTLVVYWDCAIYEKVSQGMLYRIRNRLFRKILNQDMKFYDTYRTGDLMTRLTGDLDAVRHMMAWVVRMVIECGALLLSAVVYFFYMDWLMAICVLALSPLICIVTIAFKKAVAPMHNNLREKLSELNTAAQENISGYRVVKAFAREGYEMDRFQEKNRDYSDAKTDTALMWLRYFPAIEGCANALPVILMLFGGIFLMNGRLTMGEYVAYSGLLWTVANPMRNFGSIINEFQRFHSAAMKVMELDYEEPGIVSPEGSDRNQKVQGHVVFDHVSFAYGDHPILEDISLDIAPGQTIAIMGETGSGKTSLIQLIPRFYDVNSGSIRIDGKDVREWNTKALRSGIGMATQDVLLFSDSIDGNIAYGDSDMPEDNVKCMAKRAAASEFIDSMPEGYNTIIGERGVGLSGGQKQRISLARAMAIHPGILILDDTTSAVDMETEKRIQHSLTEIQHVCTKIIIAQRISSTKDADQIFILEHGRVTEHGTHQELMAKKGYYYQVAMLQTGGEQ